MSYASYKTINSLDEISFIAGTTYTMTFNIYDEDGVPVDIVLCDFIWKMAYYGQPDYTILTKAGVPGTYAFTVTIDPGDTTGLSGKFIHQGTLTDYDGNIYKPAQGTIVIVEEIP